MRKILLVFAIMLAVFLVGCPNAPSNDVQEVKEYQASNLKASGATNVPEDEQGIIDLFANAGDMEEDPFVTDLSQFFESFNNGSGEDDEEVENTDKGVRSIAKRALSAAKDLDESLATQIAEILEHLEAFPTEKRLEEMINVNGKAIGNYLIFTRGEATLNANAETTDEAAIAEDLSNLEEISGDGTLEIEINPTNALYDINSAIKDVKFKTNAAGNAKLIMPTNDENPPTATLNYTESLQVGLSFRSGDKGGKFILKENAECSGAIDFVALMETEDPSVVTDILVPHITITLKVYNDADEEKFSKTYESIEEFTTAFTPEEPTE